MELSVLIPARNEVFLARTVENVLANSRGDTEVVVVCDGAWADPPLVDDPRLLVSYQPTAIGQRAATNLAAHLASGRYVMKLDAHCAVDEGFDVKLVAAGDALGRDVTQIPAQYNLHAFNWQCRACGRETYQGPTPVTCGDRDGHELAASVPGCGASAGFTRAIVWEPRRRGAKGNGSDGKGSHVRTEFWRFDHELHFQYWDSYRERPQAKGDIADVMSSVGACFVMRRDRFFELGGLDEAHGSWGQYGVEIACKSWLSGGRHVTNKTTWFAHLFRTQGGDFSFPYENPGNKQADARRYSQRLWRENRWTGQTRPLSWLIDHFAPIPDWHDPAHAAQLQQVQQAGAAFHAKRLAVSA